MRIFLTISIFFAITLKAQVGIKTTEPSRDLDVNGTLRTRTITDKSGDTNYDRVLIADANGNVDYVQKSKLHQPYAELFNVTTLPSVFINSNTNASTITTQTITLAKPALVLVNFSVPITLTAASTDGRAHILRTHLLVDNNAKVKATNIYTNTPSSGSNLSGIFYNTGSYSIELPAGNHTIALEGFCVENISCTQGGNPPGTNFQATAIYNEL